MQIIKYLMLLSIFILSVIIGKYISKQYVYRLKELEEIKNALNIFKSKIKFTYEPIPQIFNEISQNSSFNISNLFGQASQKMKNETASTAWEGSINEYQGNLKQEDKEILKTLSKLLRYNRRRRSNKSNRSNGKLFRRTN